MSGTEAQNEMRFHGAGVSPGIGRGIVHVLRDDQDDVPRYEITPAQVASEIGRFEAALIQTRMQILEMQQRIAESIGAKDAAIFDAHLLVVEDRTTSTRCCGNWKGIFTTLSGTFRRSLPVTLRP
jgi:phosphotransferase system enzyme I (PtsI)